MVILVKPRLKVADEVWIATVLLHQQQPTKPDFSIEEIVERAQFENAHGTLRPGVYVHVVQHCVANRPPNPARYRMLTETANGRRRLFRIGDSYHPQREGGKSTPDATALPQAYAGLLSWYEEWCQATAMTELLRDPLLNLVGSGKQLWADEHADEYVRRLRESWE